MSDVSLAERAFSSVASPEFSAMSPKARLESFAWAYCRTVAEATPADVEAEAAAMGMPSSRLHALQELVNAERARILAEVLRIFGDRESGSDHASKLDALLDDVLGTSGFEGTIPG